MEIGSRLLPIGMNAPRSIANAPVIGKADQMQAVPGLYADAPRMATSPYQALQACGLCYNALVCTQEVILQEIPFFLFHLMTFFSACWAVSAIARACTAYAQG
jgi:hypothetical protein